MDEFERPDLSDMTTDDLCGLMLACGLSDDESDKAFAKACRDEIAKRKPEKTDNVELTGLRRSYGEGPVERHVMRGGCKE